MVPQEWTPSFRHEALLHAGDEEFVERVGAFVTAGVADGEPALILAQAAKLDRLREAVGDRDGVEYVDSDALGRNPARIIPYWRSFIDAHPGQRLRGVEEPMLLGRSAAERSELHIHESLVNVAFTDASIWLLCPYDTKVLSVEDIEHAVDNHPILDENGQPRANDAFAAIDWFGGTLPDPEPNVASTPFDLYSLYSLRRSVDTYMTEFGLDARRRDEFVLAMSEIATNSLLYGGGEGTFRCWLDDDVCVCEVADRGRIGKPLAGRVRPAAGQAGGHGLYLVNQVADLVQVRSNEQGTVVRVHITKRDA
jgi:anti-sigma regulatory factor (Ser/Thr protein kinase)